MVMVLEQWYPYFGSVNGMIFGHENFADGTVIVTSRVVRLDLPQKEIVTKSGSNYKLGQCLQPDNEKSMLRSIYRSIMENR